MKKILTLFVFSLISLFLHAEVAIEPDGSGTRTDPFRISTINHLVWFQQGGAVWNSHYYFVQTADIDASDTKTWNVKNDSAQGFNPVGNETVCGFNGHYNGKGHTISNVYIKRDTFNVIGFFGLVGSSGSVDSLNLTNISVKGKNYVGGLAGRVVDSATITNCSTSGTVVDYSTASSVVGGLIGEIYQGCTVSNSHSNAIVPAQGGVVGGLIGRSYYSTVNKCYSTGYVTGNYSLGGLVGINYGSTITGSYATGYVFGNSDLGGLVGQITSKSNVSGCYSKGSVSNPNNSGSNFGGFAGKVDLASSVTNCYSNGDIFGYITSSYVGGFIGRVEESRISNSYSTGSVSGSTSNAFYMGGFVGYGTNDTITRCFSTGNVLGNVNAKYIGGFIGYQAMSSYISECYSTGDARGYVYLGGFLGDATNSTEVINCYSTGNVIDTLAGKQAAGFAGTIETSATLTDCYSIGALKDNSLTYLGGMVGKMSSGTVTDCFWDVQTSGTSTGIGYSTGNGSATGLTTPQMKRSSNFSAWDLDAVWTIHNDTTYPLLKNVKYNAPMALPDTLQGATINFTRLMANDYYNTQQGNLIYKIISCTTTHGTRDANGFTFNSSATEGVKDTVTYRVGEVIAADLDTLWGTRATSLLIYKVDNATDVATSASASHLTLYPNPARNVFTVNGLKGEATVELTDLNGKLMLQQTMLPGSTISLGSLPVGLYVAKINTGGAAVRLKLIKK